MINSKIFNTQIQSLSTVTDRQFVIPTYQRPYVWQEEQINKLLQDVLAAFSKKDINYFIGTVLTSRHETFDELIDGQQRFTTLWLIAVVFKKKKISSDIIHFLSDENGLRIDFEIRKKVADYLQLLMENPSDARRKYPKDVLKNEPYLTNIAKGLTVIENLLDSMRHPITKHEIDLRLFGNYIYRNVKFVYNIAPQKIDLNKLFAIINNSGIQLEQTDILKAKLLNRLSSEKILYGKIWEACENMNDYFERNVRKIFTKTNWEKLNAEDFKVFNKKVFVFEEIENSFSDRESKGFSLKEILDETNADIESRLGKIAVDDAPIKSNEIYCRSVINFGQLLLHTYRIYLKKTEQNDFEQSFHVNNLIEIFNLLEEEHEERIKTFFVCLWETRFIFDAYIVKWITDLNSKEEHLELTSINKTLNKNNYYFQRNVIEKSPLLMLQSVLYFTGNYNTQYWLTPYLNALSCSEPDLDSLEKIDNELSLSKLSDKEITFLQLKKNRTIPLSVDITTELKSSKGTSFKHYWFQKLEYVLWKTWKKRETEKFKNYRITSKNSVEHISPQNPEYSEALESDIMNDFGNLALLNVSQNSEYSNQEVSKKRIDFNEGNKSSYDSLKLYKIYNEFQNEWDKKTILRHRDDMVTLLSNHYLVNRDL